MKLAVSMTVIVAVFGLCLFTTAAAYDDEMMVSADTLYSVLFIYSYRHSATTISRWCP
jgi:hypothetical protein